MLKKDINISDILVKSEKKQNYKKFRRKKYSFWLVLIDFLEMFIDFVCIFIQFLFWLIFLIFVLWIFIIY